MDKQTRIDRVAESPEGRILFARLYEKLTGAERRSIVGVTCFLAPREQVLLRRMLPDLPLNLFRRIRGRGADALLLPAGIPG